LATEKTEGQGVYTRLPQKQWDAMEALRLANNRSMAAELRVAVEVYLLAKSKKAA
jgi:hypothetical protein